MPLIGIEPVIPPKLINNAIENRKEVLVQIELDKKLETEKIDVTKFNSQISNGAAHPVQDTMDRVITYFQNLNFSVEEGPLVEDDFHNFEALNFYFDANNFFCL